jgi:NADH:ubiquinone oxidoreductase subunit E
MRAVTKLPTRSPTHEEVEIPRLASMGLELEDIAVDDEIPLPALVELAEDRGRPASHYLAAIPLATELRLAGSAPLTLKICAGNCQRYGALDLLDHLAEHKQRDAFHITPVTCLDRCDQAPACELDGTHGKLVLAPATKTSLDEALASLT